MEKEYSPTRNEFDSFGKLVTKDETNARLDTAAGYLKELVFEVKNLNHNLGGKMDQMLEKQDQMLGKEDQMLGRQDEHLEEGRDMNRKFEKVLQNDILELKSDMAEVKAVP